MASAEPSPSSNFPLSIALRRSLRRGYTAERIRNDLMAGLVVSVVALPLSMGLSIASGVSPQHGLYTSIVAGFLVAVLGGSKVQVSGPTASFVVIFAPLAARYGLGGIAVATMLAGALQVVFGLVGMGKLLRYISSPVITGFTTGIAVVLATIQVKDFLGLQVASVPAHFLDKVMVLGEHLHSARWQDILIGVVTLAILVGWPKLVKSVPAPLVALAGSGLLAAALHALWPEFAVDTLATRFSYSHGGQVGYGIPQLPPLPVLPWLLPSIDGQPIGLSFTLIRELLPLVVAIATLGAIESLLSAVVADGITGQQHHSDGELIAQGIGNLCVPFLGGIAATGALSRTATNVRSGATSPLAAVSHAVFVLLGMLAFAPLLSQLPMAALAGMLLMVAYGTSNLRQFLWILRVAPRSDRAVLLICFLLTVLFDMVTAVAVGVVLSSLLFMKRMADMTGFTELERQLPETSELLPDGVMYYAIDGPLFFGAARSAMEALRSVHAEIKVVLMDLRTVPVIDATGLVNLEATLYTLKARNTRVVLVGVQDQPRRLLLKAEFQDEAHGAVLVETLEEGVRWCRQHFPAPERVMSVRSQRQG